MKYRIQVNKWHGAAMVEEIKFDTLREVEQAVRSHFGDMEWGDTQMGFHIVHPSADYNMMFAPGGPELWEISMIDEEGQLEEWDEDLLDEEARGDA